MAVVVGPYIPWQWSGRSVWVMHELRLTERERIRRSSLGFSFSFCLWSQPCNLQMENPTASARRVMAASRRPHNLEGKTFLPMWIRRLIKLMAKRVEGSCRHFKDWIPRGIGKIVFDLNVFDIEHAIAWLISDFSSICIKRENMQARSLCNGRVYDTYFIYLLSRE